MLFNSLTYLAFMALIVPAFWLGTPTARRLIILAGSITFYAFWRPDFVALVVLSAAVDFFAAQRIHESQKVSSRRLFLSLSLGINLGLLILFKYSAFIADSASTALHWLGIEHRIDLPDFVLPLGISFYTFQTISYTIDVYRSVQKPVRSFSRFLSYVMFWPQLVAGPILRAGEVIPQLDAVRTPRLEEVSWGLRRFIFGLFKKVVLADSIAVIVDEGFGLPAGALGTLDAWTLAFAFGLQIYFDFSGYSEMAVGSAAMIGIRFPENFNWPYLADSPREFWKRWHISLSAWIRDYLYLPLTGAQFRSGSTGGIEASTVGIRANAARMSGALFGTWFIMGLWHGAAWQFAVWGLWHAALIQIYRLLTQHLPLRAMSKLTWAGWPLTIAGSMLGWLFFRANDLDQAFHLLGTALDPTQLGLMAMRENSYLVVALFFSVMISAGVVVRAWGRWDRRSDFWWIEQMAVSTAIGVSAFLSFVHLREVKTFIYFQF